LDAQREACEAYILSQRQEGWRGLEARYDDGGYSGGSMERPALKQLLADIDARKVDVVVVYKIDRRDSLIALKTSVFRPDPGYLRIVNSRLYRR
jgi:site-specific DNA recombinase